MENVSIVRCVHITDCGSQIKSQEKKEKLNQLKSELLKSGKYKIWLGIQKALYFKSLAFDSGVYNHKYEEYLSYDIQFTALERDLCRKMFNSRRSRVLRLKKRIENVLHNHECLFIRLSFRDDVLQSTSCKTRRTYIQRWLKSLNCPFYVANIDFGDKEKNIDSKEREHYHAIVQSSHVDMSTYKYGYMFVQRLRYDKSSVARVSKYINKLSYHAFKESTGQYRLIYSKPVKFDRVKLFKDKRISNNRLQVSL